MINLPAFTALRENPGFGKIIYIYIYIYVLYKMLGYCHSKMCGIHQTIFRIYLKMSTSCFVNATICPPKSKLAELMLIINVCWEWGFLAPLHPGLKHYRISKDIWFPSVTPLDQCNLPP